MSLSSKLHSCINGNFSASTHSHTLSHSLPPFFSSHNSHSIFLQILSPFSFSFMNPPLVGFDAFLIGILAGAILLAMVFAAVVYAYRRKKETSQPQLRTRRLQNLELSAISVHENWSFNPHGLISMDEITKATNNFSPDLIIGAGSFGLVYKAQLSTGRVVAVKKLSKGAFHGFRKFQAEVKSLGKLRHRNIVKILGSCAMGPDRLLIYEFMEKGSLDRWLHTSPGNGHVSGASLPWETRVKIIRGVANGLRYLHGLDKPIIHRKIQSSDVLLDSEYEAHIADFGLAKTSSHSHVSTQYIGSSDYMAPEYKNGLTMANVKMDVYSFGVLMFETAMGRRPNEKEGFVTEAMNMVAQNREMDMVDFNISRDRRISEASIKEYFRIACMCCSESLRERLEMAVIVELLNLMPV